MVDKVRSFLTRNNLLAEQIDEENLLSFFMSEMDRGLAGQDSSLAMIPTYVQEVDHVAAGEKVIVLDAGGTNFRTCLISFDEEGRSVIEDFRKVPMPGVNSEVTKKEFFSILADNVERFVGRADRIGFCFSYAATITEDHDGVPIVFSKEIKAPQVIGQPVARCLLEELAGRGHDVSGMRYSVVNDTVATLLACKAGYGGPSSGSIGFILGTGTNTAYSEDIGAIGKIDTPMKGRMIINVESGNLDLDLGPADRSFFETTKNPGNYHFEKMISGAYIGPFAHHVIRMACDDGVFSPAFVQRFNAIEPLTTTRMSHYLEDCHNQDYDLVRCVGSNEDDALSLWLILRSIVERAGKLTAINLSAAVLRTDGGTNPRLPVVINADGTTFYKTAFMYDFTARYLYEFLEKRHGRFTRMIRLDDSPALGAAIAGLSL